MFLSHAVLTNKPGLQSIFAGGPLPVQSSPSSDPCRPLLACGYPPRPMTIPPTQYSPTSPAYSPTSPAVRCQRQDIPFRPLPPTTRAALDHPPPHRSIRLQVPPTRLRASTALGKPHPRRAASGRTRRRPAAPAARRLQELIRRRKRRTSHPLLRLTRRSRRRRAEPPPTPIGWRLKPSLHDA